MCICSRSESIERKQVAVVTWGGPVRTSITIGRPAESLILVSAKRNCRWGKMMDGLYEDVFET